MATAIDHIRSEETLPACDPAVQCCPESCEEQCASLDPLSPAGAVAAFAAAIAGGFASRGSEAVRAEFSRALAVFAEPTPFGEAPRSRSARLWFESLPPDKYMAALRVIGERMEELPAFAQAHDEQDGLLKRSMELMRSVFVFLKAEPWFDALSEIEKGRAGMRRMARMGEQIRAWNELVSDNIVAVISRLEGEHWFALLSDADKEKHRRKAVGELKTWMSWKSFLEKKFSKRGRITADGVALIARMTAPVEPVYPPAGKEKFDPYAPLEPWLEPTALKIADLLRGPGEGGAFDPQEAHRRAAWAAIEAQRILKSQPWASGLSVGERDALAHELNVRLVSSLSTSAFLKGALNSDGYVKMGVLKGLVEGMAPRRSPAEMNSTGSLEWKKKNAGRRSGLFGGKKHIHK